MCQNHPPVIAAGRKGEAYKSVYSVGGKTLKEEKNEEKWGKNQNSSIFD